MNFDTINDGMTMAGGAEGALLANRYRIVRQLGQGGMGSVWLAEDTQLDNKPFAIKMLPSILVSNKRAYRQLKDEALVAMRLVHPNIVQIRAFEENNGNPFLVMDYIDGQTLDDYLAEKGKLSEDETIKLLMPIAAALDYAHGEGVVHRDVKPANILIRKDGRPYILDFGIAREIQETMTRVTGKLSSGTLLYMSPEQLNGAPPTSAQDVYSFAAMVYECLKGEPPFVRGAIEDQIKNKQPEPLLERARLCSSVMAGLAKKPEDRLATCAVVLRGGGVSSASVGTMNGRVKSATSMSPQQPEGSHSRMTAAILAVALIAILGGIWWVLSRTSCLPVQEVPANNRTGGPIPVGTDIRDFAIKIPVLEFESDGAISAAISNALVKCYGVEGDSLRFDMTNRSVKVRYDLKKVGTNDVVIAVARAGYEANGVTPESVGKESLEQYVWAARQDDEIREKEEKHQLPFDIAAQDFTNYDEGCEGLGRSITLRNETVKIRTDAENARKSAREVASEQLATNSWNDATNKFEMAKTEFKQGNFIKAKDFFASAKEAFLQCVKDVDILRNTLNNVQQEAKELGRRMKEDMSDDESFADEKKAPDKILDYAERLEKLKRLSEAVTEYSNCVERCKKLISDHEDLKKNVEKERENAEIARTEASDAEKLVPDAWKAANQLFNQAIREFDEKKYTLAHSNFMASAERFRACEKEATKAKSESVELKIDASEIGSALGYSSSSAVRWPFEARIRVYILDGDRKNYVRAECECRSTAVKIRREMEDTLIVIGGDKDLIVPCFLRYDGRMKTVSVQLSGKSENIREEELK